MAQDFDESAFHQLGFEAKHCPGWTNMQESSQKKLFRTYYGTSAANLARIWLLLQQHQEIDNKTKPVYLLLTYRWMCSYQTELELHGDYGISVNTISKWTAILVKKIGNLRAIIDPNWDDHGGVLIRLSVDGIHYRVQEVKPFTRKVSSHKFGGKAALDYELCIATDKDKLAWLNGPFPAGMHDRTIFQEKGLKQKIEETQQARNDDRIRVIGDDGYFKQELLSTLSFRNEFDPQDIAYFKDRALSRHESFNQLTKHYAILNEPFRHERGVNEDLKFPLHKACMEAICVTIQLELDNGETSLLDPYPE